ncbi:MAG: AmmeMemoRadiSam system protein B [bacterium]
MFSSKKQLLTCLALGLILGLLWQIGVYFNSNPLAPKKPESELMKNAINAKDDWIIPAGAQVFIVPHHLVAIREIVSLLSAMPTPTTVYLLVPDHFSRSPRQFATSDLKFFEANLDLPLVRLPLLDATMTNEPSLPALLPILDRFWPEIRVVPILVRLDTALDDCQKLATAISKELKNDPSAIMIGSIDFSHYQSLAVANFHDLLARDVIKSLAASSANQVELDSPGALAATLLTATELGQNGVRLFSHTNSNLIMNAGSDEPSTSHFIAAFFPGAAMPAVTATFMILPRSIKDASGLLGEENRFFRGVDAIITPQASVRDRLKQLGITSFPAIPKTITVRGQELSLQELLSQKSIQDLEKRTDIILGIAVTNGLVTPYLFPIVWENNRAVLATGPDRENTLKK